MKEIQKRSLRVTHTYKETISSFVWPRRGFFLTSIPSEPDSAISTDPHNTNEPLTCSNTSGMNSHNRIVQSPEDTKKGILNPLDPAIIFKCTTLLFSTSIFRNIAGRVYLKYTI